MPGCESLEKIGPDEYRMKMKVLLAALSGEFEGKMRIADQAPPTSFRLIVEGSGRIGFLKGDRKSTRLNSSHGYISYAVFCLKKKKHTHLSATCTLRHLLH